MLLETKIKQAAIMAAVDVRLRKMKKSPERCSRNILEVGTCAYPDRMTKQEEIQFFNCLCSLCEKEDAPGARELFMHTFFTTF